MSSGLEADVRSVLVVFQERTLKEAIQVLNRILLRDPTRFAAVCAAIEARAENGDTVAARFASSSDLAAKKIRKAP